MQVTMVLHEAHGEAFGRVGVHSALHGAGLRAVLGTRAASALSDHAGMTGLIVHNLMSSVELCTLGVS